MEQQDIFAPNFAARPWWWEAAEPEPISDEPLPARQEMIA